MVVRRLAAALAVMVSLGSAAAQEPPQDLPSDVVPNWTAPPFWTPPAAVAFEKLREAGVLETMAVEGLPTSALPFFAIQPCRIVDTRGNGFTGAYGPPAMVANASRDFDLNSAAHCPGIPVNAEAYSINVTVTQTTGLGDVRLWPTGSPPAVPVSTQNWPTAGLSLANAAIVPAGTNGAITVYVAGSSTHLIIDINGYYAPISIVNTVNGLSGAVTLAPGTNISITPSGNTLTIANTAPAPPAAWQLSGNGGTTPGTNFLGTTDNLALEIKVNGNRAMRLEPTGGSPNVLLGLAANSVAGGVVGSTIGGGGVPGFPHTVGTGANYAVVAGGGANHANGLYSTVGGGSGNTASNYAGTVAGGYTNLASFYAAIAGGSINTANGNSSAIGGGVGNTTDGSYATIPGGSGNSAAGGYSFAAGRQANAGHDGAFVWGDSTDAAIASTAVNQFTARATGGFRFIPSATVSCTLTDVTGWQCASVSDRNAKREFSSVDTRETLARLLDVPIQTWSYKVESAPVRHMGPMAQDFAAAYGLGSDDKAINPLDANGVALAAIQGLYELVREKDAEIDALKARLSRIEAKLE
jgi:endosialidase-like protein